MSDTDVVMSEMDAQIDAWAEKTRGLTGKVCQERQPWNVDVTADSIRHFAYGSDDDNPLWTDQDYAARSAFGKLQAPPAFLVSSLYPILHGAPMKAPLASLIGGVEYESASRSVKYGPSRFVASSHHEPGRTCSRRRRPESGRTHP